MSSLNDVIIWEYKGIASVIQFGLRGRERPINVYILAARSDSNMR